MDRIILITEELNYHYQQMIQKKAEAHGFKAVFKKTTDQDFSQALHEAEVFFGIFDPNTSIPKNLKWIALPLAGVNSYLNKEELLSGKCLLTCSSGAYGTTIAEHLIMSILMVLRRIPEYLQDQKEGIWRNDRHLSSIYNSRITILGTGDIGSSFANLAKAFCPQQIIGINRSGVCLNQNFDQIRPIQELDQVLQDTDILVMALPETPKTCKILNQERIALLPKNALVANVGRGSSIDQKALTVALTEKRIGGACLDVLEIEPITSNDPLLGLSNVLITPHMSGQRTLDRTVEIMINQFIENIENYAQGKALKKLVDLHKGY